MAAKPLPQDPGSTKEMDERLAIYRRSGSAVDELHYRVTRDIVAAGRRWRKLANERIKAAGQTMARWETLFLVAFSERALNQSELARVIGIEGPTLVRMLDLLEKDGLIERRQSQTDRRVTTNSITPAGMKVIEEVMVITDQARVDLFKDFNPKELEQALKVLTRIIDRLEDLR